MFGTRFTAPLSKRHQIIRSIRGRGRTIRVDNSKLFEAIWQRLANLEQAAFLQPKRLSPPIVYPRPVKYRRGNAMQEMRAAR